MAVRKQRLIKIRASLFSCDERKFRDLCSSLSRSFPLRACCRCAAIDYMVLHDLFHFVFVHFHTIRTERINHQSIKNESFFMQPVVDGELFLFLKWELIVELENLSLEVIFWCFYFFARINTYFDQIKVQLNRKNSLSSILEKKKL